MYLFNLGPAASGQSKGNEIPPDDPPFSKGIPPVGEYKPFPDRSPDAEAGGKDKKGPAEPEIDTTPSKATDTTEVDTPVKVPEGPKKPPQKVAPRQPKRRPRQRALKPKETKSKPNKPKLTEEEYQQRLELSRNVHTFGHDFYRSFSLGVDVGYVRQNFFNENFGFNYQGFQTALRPGIRIPVGEDRNHVFTPHIYYQAEMMDGTKATIIPTRAWAHRLGIGVSYLYEAVPKWFQVGGFLAAGASIIRTKDGNLQGVIANGNSLPRPVKDEAVRFEVGPKFCTIQGAACLYGSYGADMGMKIGEQGLNITSMAVGLSIDAMRFIFFPTPKEIKKQNGRK